MLRSVRRQIMYIFILVTIIPVLAVGVLAVSVLKKQMRERYEEQVEAENTRVKSILFDITLSLYNGCEPIVTWQAYRDLLATEDFSKSDRANHDSLTRSLPSPPTTPIFPRGQGSPIWKTILRISSGIRIQGTGSGTTGPAPGFP